MIIITSITSCKNLSFILEYLYVSSIKLYGCNHFVMEKKKPRVQLKIIVLYLPERTC